MEAALDNRLGVQSEVDQENTGVIERSEALPSKSENLPSKSENLPSKTESGPVSAFRRFRTQPAVQR